MLSLPEPAHHISWHGALRTVGRFGAPHTEAVAAMHYAHCSSHGARVNSADGTSLAFDGDFLRCYSRENYAARHLTDALEAIPG